MTVENAELERHVLAVRLHSENVPVSYLSSLLRVIQAALREVARSEDAPRRRFEQSPQPILLLSRLSADNDLTMHLTFADPIDSTPLEDLSAQTFAALLDRFGEFVRGLPQPSLWGGAAPRPSHRPFESELVKRMDQLHRELRRSSRATVRHRDRTIEIDGDRMEFT
jgi:hypothetical protein